MIVLGLTGSIGMGKTTTARLFKFMRIPVFEADKCVHDLLARDKKAIKAVKEKFPNCAVDGKIDRSKLRDYVMRDVQNIKVLEKILHPFVRFHAHEFLRRHNMGHRKIVVLDIPLLFEGGFHTECDYTITVTTHPIVQRNRVLGRRGITPDWLIRILSLQISDQQKRNWSDFVVYTGLGRRYTFDQLREILKEVKSHA